MKSLFLTVGLVALVSNLMYAQEQRPDFSGIWEMDRSRSDAAKREPPIGSVTVQIFHMPAELRIDTTLDNKSESVTYRPADLPAADGQPARSTFRWEGSRLITNGQRTVNEMTVTVNETRSLNATGTEMSVQTTLVVQHGYQGTGDPKNSSTGTNVFIRKK